MLADEPTLEPGLYRLPEDPVGTSVLIPGFRSATTVRGAFGWFSAGWIARLAPGLAEYINRQDTKPIDFTVAPALWKAERAAAERGYATSPQEASEQLAHLFVAGRADASALAKHTLDCLAWLLATNRLCLRVVVPKAESNYHPKVWLFDDGADQVLVRGSGNATGRGIETGIEHFDVDVSWVGYSQRRVEDGAKILYDWATGRSTAIERVVDLPEALKQGIVRTAPENPPTPQNFFDAVRLDGSPRWATDPMIALRERFAAPVLGPRPRLAIPPDLRWRAPPYEHQAEAVTAWESDPRPNQGTISMATGAGKTITALICATRLQDRLGQQPLLVVVSAPSRPLIAQWTVELRKFGIRAIAPSLEPRPDLALTNLFRGLSHGGTHVLVVTNRRLCSPRFQTTVTRRMGEAITLLIGDEAHTLGAPGFLANKPVFFNHRLALSATPLRQFDPDGTEEIFDFFGEQVYDFGLDRAIGFCLCPYRYYVHAATLSNNEVEEFVRLTRQLRLVMARQSDKDDDAMTRLAIARRRILETSHSKLDVLRRTLEHRGPRSLEHTLIYASAKNPRQFLDIEQMLHSYGVRVARVTERTKSAEWESIRETFVDGGYQVLLAKKVLDEGVDIPSVREAFIVASSTVHREWVQRRGRILRRHPGKPWAVVHDFLALPPAEGLHIAGDTALEKIVRTELGRAYAFAAHADNVVGDDGVHEHLDRIRTTYWPDGPRQDILQQPGDTIIAPATPRGYL